MTFTEAAAQVLRLVGKPLHYKEITDVAIEKDLLSHVGKSPEVTMGARLAALAKKGDKDNPLVRVKPGVFALREWDKATVDKGLQDRTPALERIAQQAGESSPEEPAPVAGEPEKLLASHEEVDDDANPPDAEERRRAEFAADAGGIFEAEEDDDEPIFGSEPEVEDDKQDSGSRRRRRRRRRGRGDLEVSEGEDDLPSYTVSDVPEGIQIEEVQGELRAERTARGNRNRRDRDQRERAERPERAERAERPGRAERPERDVQQFEGAVGRRLADALVDLLASYDRNRGSVSLQSLADAVKRGGEAAELTPSAGLLAAAVRCDNFRRAKEGQRMRFRLNGNRVALEDWMLEPELLQVEQQLLGLVARHRELSQKALVRALGGLPHRALGELVILLLEQLGFSGLTQVRRPGSHGAELHLQGSVQHAGGELRTAVIVRRDAREIGRERVTELRGALHHYGPAAQGYLITAGQVLSGAREEARAPGAAPVTLFDGQRLAQLCLSHGVLVSNSALPLLCPDYAQLDALRAGS